MKEPGLNKGFLIPTPQTIKSQTINILKGAGLPLLKAKLFTLNSETVSIEGGAYTQESGVGYDKIGFLGLPVWDTVTLISPAYTDNSGKNVPSQKIELDIALVEINNNRNIVKTSIAGRDGTVKEYMSNGDDDVTIIGQLVGKYSNINPTDLMKAFNFITSVPVALSVESNFINFMEIFYLVAEDAKIKQIEGTRNVFDIEIKCCSDIPFELDA